jgi:glutaminyl-peptide cyclotransferase
MKAPRPKDGTLTLTSFLVTGSCCLCLFACSLPGSPESRRDGGRSNIILGVPPDTAEALPDASESTRPNSGDASAICSEDADCPDGFCDSSGNCAAVDPTIGYGVMCKPTPVEPNGGFILAQNRCGVFFCVDGRCRSCRSDQECRNGNRETDPIATCRRVPPRPGNQCGAYGSYPTLPPITSPGVVLPYTESRIVVRRIYPHALDAFTEGLLILDGWLFESTGLVGSSSLRRVELATGRVDKKVALPRDVFGEGLAAVGDRLIQLSYDSGRAFVWDKSSLTLVGEFRYEGQGWGLCFNGTHLIMSNGTDVLQLRDPTSFALVGQVPVRKRGLPIDRLNELECVGGDVYANIFQQRHIARIELSTGKVTNWIDTFYLLEQSGPGADTSMAADLNGIAYIPESGRLLLTGKRWPAMFEVDLKPLLEP